ncbi:Zinc-regulated transporter 1 [Blumeria hordei DH14]|uniref:Zinc-regulated transporter 1 n=1 Tax=Blumeria graminis f. sp. hordei (strain DH14) TaxID=546991 RepID=N1JM86_BLUG1|nr:Zinc-regulated transporter 1 [Blumeria hordei DH14]
MDTTECNQGNGYDHSNFGIRVSSIFVIFAGSLIGVLLPFAAVRSKRLRVPDWVLTIMKYFGSGVIIATAFIHVSRHGFYHPSHILTRLANNQQLLAPATEALNSPCLSGPITEYSWAEGIALMSIFFMFFIELMATRFEALRHESQDLETVNLFIKSQFKAGKSSNNACTLPSSHQTRPANGVEEQGLRDPTFDDAIAGTENDVLVSPTSVNHQIAYDDNLAVQLTAIFILEFGIIFHSIFIGLTLAVTPNKDFKILYIVLTFHQTFEGLGLGTRLIDIASQPKKNWIFWVLALAFSLTTPASIALGLSIHESFSPDSRSMLMVNGIFDSISAGILIYTGLVELMAHEFMFNPTMRTAPMTTVLFAFLNMCLGAGLMAMLGKWA